MTLKEIQLKLYENLKPVGWGDKLKMFLLSEEFGQILATLYKNSQEGKRFTPILKNLFRAFTECPYQDLKVVMVNTEPYPLIEVADGIAFSCTNSTIELPLVMMFDEIKRTVYPMEDYTPNRDLKCWSNQGILMLNTALTVEVNQPESHAELWQPFMDALFDMLAANNTGIVYVFYGAKTKHWHKHVDKNNYKFFPSHPAGAAYTADKSWDSGNLFNQINKIIMRDHGEKEKIKW